MKSLVLIISILLLQALCRAEDKDTTIYYEKQDVNISHIAILTNIGLPFTGSSGTNVYLEVDILKMEGLSIDSNLIYGSGFNMFIFNNDNHASFLRNMQTLLSIFADVGYKFKAGNFNYTPYIGFGIAFTNFENIQRGKVIINPVYMIGNRLEYDIDLNTKSTMSIGLDLKYLLFNKDIPEINGGHSGFPALGLSFGFSSKNMFIKLDE